MRKNLKFKVKSIVIIGAVLLLVVGFINLVRLYQHKSWDGKERLVLINHPKQDNDLCVLVVEPDEKTITSIRLPSNTLIPLVWGYGEYRIGSVDGLSELEGHFTNLLEQSLNHYLGITIDLRVRLSCNQDLTIRQVKASLRNSQGSNWNLIDRIQLVAKTYSWDAANLKQLEVPQPTVLSSRTAPDGLTVFSLNDILFTEIVQDMIDKRLEASRPSVTIINSSGFSGMAGRVGLTLSRMGYDVIALRTGIDQNDQTVIQLDPNLVAASSVHEKNVSTLWPFALIENLKDVDEYRSQIVINLGKDYADFINSPQSETK